MKNCLQHELIPSLLVNYRPQKNPKSTISIIKSEKNYNTKMTKILITVQLLFVLSSGKHILHWKVPSVTAALVFQLSQTLKVRQNSVLADIQSFIIMHH